MALKACFDKADYLIQQAEQAPLKLSPGPPSKWKSLHRKVRAAYNDALITPPSEKLRPTSNLLATVAKKLTSARLVVNLFPINDGYSITLTKNDGSFAETLHMSYEEQEILDFIDNEELPPLLVDTLHRSHVNAFYCGSVLAEIKDYRISADEYSYETYYVLLKPTQQTMKNDVNIIVDETSSIYKWGIDDKLALESYLTLATSEPLCLDNSPVVAIVKNQMQARTKWFNTKPFKNCIRRNGAPANKRAQVLKTQPAPSALKLHDFLQKRKRQKKDHSSSPDVKLPIQVVDVWRKSPLQLDPPEEVDMETYISPFTLPGDNSNEDIIEVQSILLESEGINRDVCSRITIGQRPRDMQYFGMLQSNKYFKQNVMDNKDTNQIFTLGTEHRANLYILQYQELFTEDGRRPAKVTVRYADQSPLVYHIPNQQQPWQLSQERSVYSVRSVINIPTARWRKMNGGNKVNCGPRAQQTSVKQTHKTTIKMPNSTQMASTPTLNAITLQNSNQSAFPFMGSTSAGPGRRLSKVKSNNTSESAPTIQSGRRSRQGSDYTNLQPRPPSLSSQSPIQDNSGKYTKLSSEGSGQSYTLNSSPLATALNQIGASVSIQLPVMTVNSQRVTNANSQHSQVQGRPTTVLRMPVGISGSASNSNQITAALNLLGGGQNLLASNVVGNIQLTTGAGGITIPASQLPANLAMQLTSAGNSNPRQISLVTATSQSPSNITSQQISLVGQSGTSTPFTIVANNDNWQIQEAVNAPSNQQQTYTIAPRTLVSANGRSCSGQQQQQVQVVQQLQIPSHLLNTIATSNDPVTVQQLMAAAAKHNQNRRMTPE